MHTYIQTYNTYIHTYIHTFIHTYIHTHTRTHTHTLTCHFIVFVAIQQGPWSSSDFMASNYGKSSEWTVVMDVEGMAVTYFEIIRTNICLETYKNQEKSQNRRSMRRDLNLEPPKHDITFGLSAAWRNRLQSTVYEAQLHSERAFYYRHVKARLIWNKVFDSKNIFE
jgi:hypothetical protein